MWLQLAQISDEYVAARLVHMAEDFRHKAKSFRRAGAVRARAGVVSGQRRCGWSATPMILRGDAPAVRNSAIGLTTRRMVESIDPVLIWPSERPRRSFHHKPCAQWAKLRPLETFFESGSKCYRAGSAASCGLPMAGAALRGLPRAAAGGAREAPDAVRAQVTAADLDVHAPVRPDTPANVEEPFAVLGVLDAAVDDRDRIAVGAAACANSAATTTLHTPS